MKEPVFLDAYGNEIKRDPVKLEIDRTADPTPFRFNVQPSFQFKVADIRAVCPPLKDSAGTLKEIRFTLHPFTKAMETFRMMTELAAQNLRQFFNSCQSSRRWCKSFYRPPTSETLMTFQARYKVATYELTAAVMELHNKAGRLNGRFVRADAVTIHRGLITVHFVAGYPPLPIWMPSDTGRSAIATFLRPNFDFKYKLKTICKLARRKR
jgi:hypothetical protein